MKNISVNARYFSYLQPFLEMFFERAKRGISLGLRPERRTKKKGEIPRFARNDRVFSKQRNEKAETRKQKLQALISGIPLPVSALQFPSSSFCFPVSNFQFLVSDFCFLISSF
jgi:hypothetical protein